MLAVFANAGLEVEFSVSVFDQSSSRYKLIDSLSGATHEAGECNGCNGLFHDEPLMLKVKQPPNHCTTRLIARKGGGGATVQLKKARLSAEKPSVS